MDALKQKRVAKTFKHMAVMKLKLTLLSILLLLIVFWIISEVNIKPLMKNMAEAKARAIAVEAINEAVAYVIDEDVQYGDLVTILLDSNGKVAMIQANSMRMNELASKMVLTAQHNLDQLTSKQLSIPLFSLLGSQTFAGSGPMIPFKILPIGSVTTEFKTEFEACGINQTRHKIFLEAKTLVRIVIPLGADAVEVRSHVPVAESIIIGQVPDTYINVQDKNQMLNLIP